MSQSKENFAAAGGKILFTQPLAKEYSAAEGGKKHSTQLQERFAAVGG